MAARSREAGCMKSAITAKTMAKTTAKTSSIQCWTTKCQIDIPLPLVLPTSLTKLAQIISSAGAATAATGLGRLFQCFSFFGGGVPDRLPLLPRFGGSLFSCAGEVGRTTTAQKGDRPAERPRQQ